MVLKKQTIWLMTMLSLTIVLAVYYVMSPDETAQEATEEEMTEKEWTTWLDEEELETIIEETEPQEDSAQEVQGYTEGNNLFSELRMEREEIRSRLNEQYTEQIASDDFTAEEKSKAYEERERLQQLAQNESTLESLVQAEGYEDAVVITSNQQTRVIVKASELSKEEAAHLHRLARKHLGVDDVVIGHYN
ncbi:SpoIIIAH-like family protein [Aliibacillus thermotolerans]|uniref:SpoIIIAH-like family protein n=1 Tax=Aliibacillus thermotolerans TaxID=1834418 RepID=A0ABW0U8T7_9BACI|nr:SpoIIIAH-like family protein [Aliibacillus thermotolerans]